MSNCQGYELRDFVTKRERDKHIQEMEVVYSSRIKECMMKICFIELGT